ncbi:SpoIIE family protein phosphatase [Streptomyces sp. WM4235]|uniref:SpoIIE family protein phosphatase n=1 Tax=Streptomyces sp. WM4235 TaxID=1415551 RepID=UPI0006B053E0|nr:SpoIIE family protein phosphatase [Streptomyces sp. WM4235]
MNSPRHENGPRGELSAPKADDVTVPAARGPRPGGPGPAERPDAGGDVGPLAATVERLRREVREAQSASDGRALIEMAKGVLVGKLGCGPAEAARQLAILAEQSGTTVLGLSVEIINEASRDRVSELAAEFLDRAAADGDDTDGSAAVRLRAAESGLLSASDAQAVATALLENALAPLGAHGVVIWLAGADSSLTLAGQAGFTEDEALRWRYVPPEVATCARLALVERGPAFVSRLSDSGMPSIGRRRHPHGGRIAVPAGTGGRIHGVLEVCWPQPLAPQPPRIIRQIEALAELCAHTLEDPTGAGTPSVPGRTPHAAVAELTSLADHLHDPALVLTPILGPAGGLTDFRVHHANDHFTDPAGRPRSAVGGSTFLEAYPLAAEDNGLFEKLERVYATGESFQTRRMTLTAFIDDVPLTAVADASITRHGTALLLIWRIEDETARLASLLQHAQRLGRIGGFEENFTTGEITWNGQLFSLYGLPAGASPVPLEALPAHAHPDDITSISRFLRTLMHYRREASVAFRLQRPDGVTRHIRIVAEPVQDADGSLFAVRGAYQDISAQHWTEVALAATRDQLAYTEAESAERSRLALQLQHAIMPPAPAPLDAPGIRIGVRYRPAESQALIGGDWYDSVVLPNGQVLLCVGDVAGHGIEAATGMVVLRNALRGLAVTGAGPAQLLTWLNAVAHHLTSDLTATAVCGIFDPERRVLRWARAGHLPPILVRGARATAFPLTKGLLLGAVPNAEYEEEEVQLEPEDTVLMYTDGLVERRDTSMMDSLTQLLGLAQRESPSLESRLDRLLTHSRSDTDDDTCLVGVQVR